MSTDQVEAVLGEPTKAREEGGQLYWEYSKLDLEIVLYRKSVLIVNQRAGEITESLRIGDHEDKAVTVVGELEPSLLDRGAKVGRMHLPEVVVKIWVRDEQVIKAQLTRPGRDN